MAESFPNMHRCLTIEQDLQGNPNDYPGKQEFLTTLLQLYLNYTEGPETVQRISVSKSC